jgi:hypothetical protein
MRELAGRLSLSAKHLALVDQFASEAFDEYAQMREKLVRIPGYTTLAEQLYHGQEQRQMMLGDILLYMLTGRGYWTAIRDADGFSQFVRILMYITNLLLIQETLLSARPRERREFLRRLDAARLENFFASDEEREAYRELMAFQNRITVREPRHLYKVMDSLLPRTPGLVYELIVYVHLLVRRLGYSVPLLILQRLFRGQDTLAPPDYLLLRSDGNIFGIEVGSGMGQFSLTQGKIDQVNRFTQDTCIPVLTATVPHVYRCEECKGWITFCDRVIERTAMGECPEYMSALDCPLFGENPCQHTVYFGRIEPGGDQRRYHYHHLLGNQYVQDRALRTDADRRNRLLHYFPFVRGLERLKEV